MRFSGLENDYSYMEYDKMREKVIDTLKDDDSEIDVQYLSILIQILKGKREVLDKIKENYYGEDRDINTEVRESYNTCYC